MKKIIYTRAVDGGVDIVIPMPKTDIERVLGSLTDAQYEAHVWDRSVPNDAINSRYIDDGDIPATREFRNAWCDVTPEAIIDIDCTKAKEIALSKLRADRNAKFLETDIALVRAMETGIGLDKIKEDRQALRDSTNPLKSLNTEGKINCEDTLETIRQLSVLT